MDFSRPFTFVVVLFESLTLIPKNPKLLFFSFVLPLLLLSTLSFLLYLRTKQLLLLSTHPMDLNSIFHLDLTSQFPAAVPPLFLHPDFPIYLAIAAAFSLISFLSTLSAFILSAAAYNSRTLSLRAFLSQSCRTCPRLLLTCLHLLSLLLGYFALAAAVATPILTHFNFNRLSLILTAAAFLLLFNYLFVPLVLSLAVAVVEDDCYGLEAIGKAAALIGGKRVHGFILNVCFCGAVVGAVEMCRRRTTEETQLEGEVAWVMGAANLVFVVKALGEVAYTVLYFHCKKERGEEVIELYGKYDKLPVVMALSEDEEEEEAARMIP